MEPTRKAFSCTDATVGVSTSIDEFQRPMIRIWGEGDGESLSLCQGTLDAKWPVQMLQGDRCQLPPVGHGTLILSRRCCGYPLLRQKQGDTASGFFHLSAQ